MNKLKVLLISVLVVLGLLLGCTDWDMDRSGDAWVPGAYETIEAEGGAP